MPNNFWRARQGYDDGGSIAGLPFGAPPQQQQMTQQQMRAWSEMLENIEVPGEVGPAEELRGVGNFPFRNFGQTIGVPRMSNDELRQRVNQRYSDNPRGMTEANNIFDYMQQDPTNSDRIWEWLDPQEMSINPEQPAPPPEEPAPAPAPTPTPVPRQEYTYPTETMPQAEGPSSPSFLGGQHFGAPNFGSRPRWLPPIPPISGQTFLPRMDNQHARGGHIRARRGYADGGALSALSQQGNLQPGMFLPESQVGIHPGWGNDNAGHRYGDVNQMVEHGNPNQLFHLPEGMHQVWPDTMGQEQGELGWTPISQKKFAMASRNMPQIPPDMPAPQPSPEPEPPPERQEYTYPTETLPQAELPEQPGFMRSGTRWGPPIHPISGQTFIPEHRKGGRVNAINRARLRAVVSAKRGDFNG